MRLFRALLLAIVCGVALAQPVIRGTGTILNDDSSGGACALSTPNVPDGPDPWGGCFPGPSNTGPNAPENTMSVYSGPCTLNAPNITIDSKIVNCSPLIVPNVATGLLIKNSYLYGGVVQPNGSDPSQTASFTIQDSYIDNAVMYGACSGGPYSCPAGLYACGDPNNGTTDCGVGYRNFTILRTEIVHTNRSAYCALNCLIQDSYFHDVNYWPDRTNLAHGSSVRNEQGLTLQHNSLFCDFGRPGHDNYNPDLINGDIGCSADMSGYPDFAPIKNDTITFNLFGDNNVGIAFCIYGGATPGKPSSNDPTNATFIVITDNVWKKGANGKCGAFFHVADFNSSRTGNVWARNKFDDGTDAPPDG